MKTSIQILFMVFLLTSCGNNKKQEEQVIQEAEIQKDRIISLNGSITETLVALDYNNQIVGVDVTSTYPQSIKNSATDLGHVNKITIESIMELKPTLILGLENEISEELKKQLATAKIPLQLLTLKHNIEGSKELIQEVSKAVKSDNYSSLLTSIDADFKDLIILENKPKVLFIYARGAGMMMVAGTNTPVDEMIILAGGQNAITSFSDYKPLTPESLLVTNPDYILLFDTGLQSLGGIEGVLKIDGITQTNAGKSKNIIAMDGQLLSGFGPRVGQAVKDLNQLLSK